ncbi:hypothetical protein [Streptacidiphilus sp. PAMC 29251]
MGDDVDGAPCAFDVAVQQDSRGVEEDLVEAVPDRRLDDHVDDTGLVFEDAECHPLGGRGPLYVFGEAADAPMFHYLWKR